MIYGLSILFLLTPLIYAVLLTSRLSRQIKLITSVIIAFFITLIPIIVLLFE